MRDRLSRRDFLIGAGGLTLAASGGGLVTHLARAATTPILPAPSASGIEHVVVVMMENRSFHHFLGWLPGADGKQAGLAYPDGKGGTRSTYDLSDFWAAAAAGRLPAASFLKAPACRDGHASSSDPLDEQTFLVQTINRIEKLPDWKSTAIVVTYDDSDGWYDHAFVDASSTPADPVYDGLYGQGNCGVPAPGAYPDRCGPGPRLPLLVLSPYAKPNYVSHVQLEQASVLRFIEDNWNLGRLGDQSFDARAASLGSLLSFSSPNSTTLILDPATGNPPSAISP